MNGIHNNYNLLGEIITQPPPPASQTKSLFKKDKIHRLGQIFQIRCCSPGVQEAEQSPQAADNQCPATSTACVILQQEKCNLCSYSGICKPIEFQITRHLLLVLSDSAIRVNWLLKHLPKNWEMIRSFYFKGLIKCFEKLLLMNSVRLARKKQQLF